MPRRVFVGFVLLLVVDEQQTFISHRSGGWKSKVEVLTDSVLGQGLLPGLLTTAFSVALPQCLCIWRKLWCLFLF